MEACNMIWNSFKTIMNSDDNKNGRRKRNLSKFSSITTMTMTMGGAMMLIFIILQLADGSPASSLSSSQLSQKPSIMQYSSTINTATNLNNNNNHKNNIVDKSSRPPKYSSRISQQAHKRSTNPFQSSPSSSSNRDEIDFSHGFPSGFTQGLPSFDFTKPMSTTSKEDENGEPITEDTNNIGFVDGPPKGFPTLEQLGGSFPSFDNDNMEHRGKMPSASEVQFNQPQGASSYRYQTEANQQSDNSYLSSPGPISVGHNSPIVARLPPPPPPPPLPIPGIKQGYIRGPIVRPHNKKPHNIYQKYPSSKQQQQHPFPPQSRQPQQHHSQQHVAGSYGGLKFNNHIPKQMASSSSSKPFLIKMNGNNNGKSFKQVKLPPGPPVFFAPSPDVHPTNVKNINGYRTLQSRQSDEQLQRFKRSTSSKSEDTKSIDKDSKLNKNKEDKALDDLIADGSEQGETYWQITPASSPFISFDTYKSSNNNYVNSHEITPRRLHNSNERSHEDHDDKVEQERNHNHHNIFKSRSDDSKTDQNHQLNSTHEELEPISGEQRFFPSFPASSPYLGLGGIVPFHGLPHPPPPQNVRPPLFPGPTVNRSPSRYYPQFGGGGGPSNKYSSSSLGPPPNRGPSNIFTSSSAENHDHYQDNNLLGSGNFEIVRGGTYYQDDDGHDYYHGGGSGLDGDGDYYQHHNGHSAPQGYRVPGTDFFANFRDFADINPPSRSFSHHHETKIELNPNSNNNNKSNSKLNSSNNNNSVSKTATINQNSNNNKKPNNILDKLQSTSESLVPHDHHEFSSSSSETDPMIATF